MLQTENSHVRRSILRQLPVLLVFVWLVGVAFFDKPLRYAPGDILLLSVAYLLFACTSLWGIGWLLRVHRLAGAAGSAVLSPLYVWHFREVFRLPDLKSQVPLACAGAAVILFVLAFLGSRHLPSRRLLVRSVVSLLMCIGIVGLSYGLSQSLRFELLRRHTLFGFPAWSVLGPSIGSIEKSLWNDHAGVIAQTPNHVFEEDRGRRGPTIVFVLLDTLRRDALTAYGGDAGLMPQLNELARESVVFEDVLANASRTKPSVGSIFTGLYQEYHGAVGGENGLAQSNETLAELLSAEGYETAAFVSNWGAVGKDTGFDQGFATFRECKSPDSPYLRAGGLTREVIDWVTRRRQDSTLSQAPLFLYVHYLDPHVPYLSGGYDSNVFAEARSAYNHELAYLDAHVSHLIRSLEQIVEGPLVTVVAADHGEEFGEHGGKGHGFTLYEEVVRIPVFIRSPDHRGALNSARLEGRDLFDLVLQAATKLNFDPSSWAFSKDRAVRYTSEYLRSGFPIYRPDRRHVCLRAIERDGLFFIRSALGPTIEIYDKKLDPFETRNLIRPYWALAPGLNRDIERLTPLPWADRKSALLTGDTLEQLKALGYIE